MSTKCSTLIKSSAYANDLFTPLIHSHKECIVVPFSIRGFRTWWILHGAVCYWVHALSFTYSKVYWFFIALWHGDFCYTSFFLLAFGCKERIICLGFNCEFRFYRRFYYHFSKANYVLPLPNLTAYSQSCNTLGKKNTPQLCDDHCCMACTFKCWVTPKESQQQQHQHKQKIHISDAF